MMTLGLLLHSLAATVWVGGMFFAYVVLRPVAGGLEGPARLALWRGVFGFTGMASGNAGNRRGAGT